MNEPSGFRYEIKPPSSNSATITGSGAAGIACSIKTPLEADTIADGASELRPDDNTNRPGQFGTRRHGNRDLISSNVIDQGCALISRAVKYPSVPGPIHSAT